MLVITGIALGLWSSGPALAAADPVASIVLSTMAPGVGEWYNSGFAGGFPVVECVMGRVCPCVGFASIIDAAAGHTDDGIRFDFWSSPN
ncbi:MAG: hypothetical protein JXX28_15675 [Deltaproteobacteria bacterium]|nr:hypothetical protein [Deltaproteobacteria bacterium]